MTLDFSKPTLIRAVKYLNLPSSPPLTRGRENLIGQRRKSTRSSLVCFSLQSQQRRQGKPKPPMPRSHEQNPTKPSKEWQGEPMPHSATHCLPGYILPSFPNSMCPLKHSLQQNITCPLSKQRAEKHHVSVLSKTSSHTSASVKHPFIRQF